MSERAFDREIYLRLIEVAGARHDEAEKCAAAGAWLAACVMLGAAVEGVLLVTAANAESGLRARGLWPKGDPLRWDLGVLVRLGMSAGWFAASDLEAAGLTFGEILDGIRNLRNVVHPGAFVREGATQDDIGERVYRAAYSVLDILFGVSAGIVEATPDEPVDDPG